MTRWKVALFCQLPLLWTLCAGAQNAEDCKIKVEKLVVPAVILHEFFSPLKNSKVYLPLPKGHCFSSGAINIFDPLGRQVGRLQAKRSWDGRYISSYVGGYGVDSVPYGFRESLVAKGVNDNEYIEMLISWLYSQASESAQGPIRIIEGEFIPVSGYYFKLDADSIYKSKKSLRTIRYDELVRLLSKKTPIYSTLGEELLGLPERWRIPGTRASAFSKEMELNTLPSFSGLLRAANSERRMIKPETSPTAIIYGASHLTLEMVVLIEWMKMIGFKEVVWFKGGGHEWNYPERIEEKTNSSLMAKNLTAGQLQQFLGGKDTLLVDVRSRRHYFNGRIKGAEHSEFKAIGESGLQDLEETQPQWVKFLRDSYWSRGWVIYLERPLEQLLKPHHKRLVVYYHREDPDFGGTLSGYLNWYLSKQKYQPQVYFYGEGYVEWALRSYWNKNIHTVSGVK